MLATEAGRIAWRAQLDVYGVPREEQGVAAAEERTANPWRFPGQYEDAETGLYYNRFRYYDPGLGRYLSEDPIGLSGGVALFGYVSAPPTWIDPLGLAGCGSQAKPALTDDPWSPAEVAKRQAARLHDNGPLAAEALGFRPTSFRSHGQPVYVSGRRFITPDVDSHIGGAWKMADSPRNLGSKPTRMGTYDRELNRIGD